VLAQLPVVVVDALDLATEQELSESKSSEEDQSSEEEPLQVAESLEPSSVADQLSEMSEEFVLIKNPTANVSDGNG